MKDKISVIIATYNRRNYLDEAIESVLSQTYDNYEIIIINDCSKDDTVEFINKKYKDNKKVMLYTNKKNMGISYNHKLGLEYAIGEYVIFLDDDDKFIKDDYFAKAIELFHKHNDIAFVSSAHVVYNTSDNSKTEKEFSYQEVVDNKEFFLHFAAPNYPKPIISSTIIKKEAFNYEGNQKIEMLNDVAIFLYALLYGKMGFINETAGQYLVHGENISFHCSADFIVLNLEEKYRVYKIAQNKFSFTKEELKKWLCEQSDITIIYFINGSKPSKKDFVKVAKWARKRLGWKKYFQYKKIYKDSKNQARII